MKPTRVILINPRMSKPRAVRLPLSLLALGAVLEGRYDYRIVDGNAHPDPLGVTLGHLSDGVDSVVGVTVMPGPQVAPAIEISAGLRAARPEVPIVWGGYFPTLYPDSAVNAPYVDLLVRGQGEDTLLELLERHPVPAGDVLSSSCDETAFGDIPGLTWKRRGEIVHNPERLFRPPGDYPPYAYERVDVGDYLRPSFLGSRTGVHQAAIGCRFRCTFCGVVSMFNGHTSLEAPQRLDRALSRLRGYGADAMQFFDHNFFDREESSVPILEVMARHAMPWWCYARADTLARFSDRTWRLIRKSRLAMTYIGAESADDEALRRMRKGSRVQHTLEVAARCREFGVIPEFSFMLGGPEDPEAEVDKTLRFIRRLKAIYPECEVILYFYSPTPQRDPALRRSQGAAGDRPLLNRFGPNGPELPTTPEEWTQQRWLDYVCHRDAPWLTHRLRQHIRDFSLVFGCRFPSVQDYSTSAAGKALLRALASWRYSLGVYSRPWELRVARRLIRPRDPREESI